MKKTLLFATLLALAGASSVAAAADDSWFVRGNLGSSNLHINSFGSTSSNTAGGVSGGYYFTPNIGIEGRYQSYGNHGDSLGNSLDVDGWGLGVVGKYDFGPDNTGFYIDGRAGWMRMHAKATLAGVGSASINKSKGYAGVGAGYDFNRNFGVGLNYEYAGAGDKGNSAHTNTWSVSAEARF
ncbi:MAG: porin family protein [Proteobacteria bacterium]|nr:porin family protein [Pseudomonadota bacterium]